MSKWKYNEKKFIAGAKKLGKDLAKARKAAGQPYRFRFRRKLLATVNVIEYLNGEIEKLFAYPETKAGNVEAEKRFVQILESISISILTKEDVQAMLEDGTAEYANRRVVICHSTVGHPDD